MKKLLQGLLAILMSVSMMVLPTCQVKADALFEYEASTEKSGMIQITKYLGDESEVVFPSQIDGQDVYCIVSDVFESLEL